LFLEVKKSPRKLISPLFLKKRGARAIWGENLVPKNNYFTIFQISRCGRRITDFRQLPLALRHPAAGTLHAPAALYLAYHQTHRTQDADNSDTELCDRIRHHFLLWAILCGVSTNPMPSKTKVKISRKLRKVIHNAPCSSKTLTTTRVRQHGKLSNKQKQSVTVNLAAPACQRKVRTTLQDGAFKHVKDPIARRQLIDQKIKSLRRMMGTKKRRKRPRRAFVTPEEAASVGMGRGAALRGELRPGPSAHMSFFPSLECLQRVFGRLPRRLPRRSQRGARGSAVHQLVRRQPANGAGRGVVRGCCHGYDVVPVCVAGGVCGRRFGQGTSTAEPLRIFS
jgi:hypothetical protein